MSAIPAYSVRLPVFAGPLDLLLELIEREELDITRVSLAQVTDQFLSHLRVLEQLAIADIADFLVVAARLLLIKSEALLPHPPARPADEEDPADELARQLIAYKRYKEIASDLHGREDKGLHTYLRLAAPPPIEKKADLSGLTLVDLLEAVRRALALTPEKPDLGTVVTPPIVTIRDQIRRIAHALQSGVGRASFRGLLTASASRMEVIVTFLAVLELIKRHKIEARQERLFGEIELCSIEEWTADETVLAELEFE